MIGDAQTRQGEALDCMRSPPVCGVRWSGENMVVVEGYHGSRFHVMSFLHGGVLDGVVKPGSREKEPMTHPPQTCSILSVPLLHVSTFLYNKEWEQKLAVAGWDAGVAFVEQVEC